MFEITHLHPVLVHFPVALIIVGFLADISSLVFKKEKCLSTMGLYLEVLGLLGAIAAFITGHFMTGDTLDGAGHIGQMHELFATLTVCTIFIAVLFRFLIIYLKIDTSNLKYIATAIFFFAFIFVAITGHFGGMIVYGNL